MLKKRGTRRLVGATLIAVGALSMLLAPEGTFGIPSIAGIVLLVAGVALELIGIAIERRATRGK